MLGSPQVWLPLANTALIVISGIFLAVGYFFIRTHRVQWHRRSMITASIFAAGFVIVYVTRWALLGSKGFDGEGPWRVVYFAILISHTIIAILVAPFAFVTLHQAPPDRAHHPADVDLYRGHRLGGVHDDLSLRLSCRVARI